MSLISYIASSNRRRLLVGSAAFVLIALIGLGVMAKNGWLPHTDPLSGKNTGWFGSELPKNAGSTWNPLAAPLTTPTPQLSKEYIYAGSRLLAVEDANASAVPPADLAYWRPSNYTWYVKGGPGSTQTTYAWGTSGDIPAQGDYDGDGKTDFCVFRPSNNNWYIIYSSDSSSNTISLGSSGDVPAPADFDGDGKTDEAVFRPSNGYFYILQSSTSSTVSYAIGASGDKVAPADYDGDGKADACVWRYGSPSQFHIRRSSDGGTATVNLGSASTDKPVSADYDGDGKADYALFNNNVWTILSSSTSQSTTTTWDFTDGDNPPIPVPNDYDGDGKVDIACWEWVLGKGTPGYWYIRNSHDNSTRTEQWGKSGDIPVPAYYRR